MVLFVFFLAMGCYFSIQPQQYENRDPIFIRAGAKEGSASKRYCNALADLFRKHLEIIKHHLRPDHADSHGIRKGSATHATSCTTCPPPLPSVAFRGEWSMGKIFDTYFHFGIVGDCYLGRILAGLDPNSEICAQVPPHFTCGPENVHVQRAMGLCFGGILSSHDAHGIRGVLLLCLASMVHHSEFLKSFVRRNSAHPFGQIPILNNDDLLQELKGIISLSPNEQMQPTGIPPHVNMAVQLRGVMELCTESLTLLRQQTEALKAAVNEAIEKNDIRSGALTLNTLSAIMEEHKKYIKETMERTIQIIGGTSAQREVNPPEINMHGVECIAPYCYDGKFWDVPKGYKLPHKTKLEHAWIFWLKGQPNVEVLNAQNELEKTPVKPFRELKITMLPTSVSIPFKNCWRPILQLMESAPGIDITRGMIMTDELI